MQNKKILFILITLPLNIFSVKEQKKNQPTKAFPEKIAQLGKDLAQKQYQFYLNQKFNIKSLIKTLKELKINEITKHKLLLFSEGIAIKSTPEINTTYVNAIQTKKSRSTKSKLISSLEKIENKLLNDISLQCLRLFTLKSCKDLRYNAKKLESIDKKTFNKIFSNAFYHTIGKLIINDDIKKIQKENHSTIILEV